MDEKRYSGMSSTPTMVSTSSSNESDTRCKCGSNRNLIVCIDGTAHKFGSKNSDVIALLKNIIKPESDSDIPQLAKYIEGIGISAKRPTNWFHYGLNWLESKIDLAVAVQVEANILDAYKWLCQVYQRGDRIFLFGFSRGAYQVRALAGMVHKIGLLMPGHLNQVHRAFRFYSERNYSITEKNKEIWRERADLFKRTFSRINIPVHFVGVWDTVSSVGLVRKTPLPFTTSCDHICRFRHALALDERRVKFLPEYVYGGGNGHHGSHQRVVEDNSASDDGKFAHVKEVWFAGTHSDVGGGNATNHNPEMSGISLLWMKSQAEHAGLRINAVASAKDSLLNQMNKKPTKTLTPLWRVVEWLPVKRLSYASHIHEETTRWPHYAQPRVIVPGQKIHVSVLLGEDYTPSATFQQEWESWPEQLDWNDPVGHMRLKDLGFTWEKDLVHQRQTHDLLIDLRNDDLSNLERALSLVEHLAFMARFGQEENEMNVSPSDGQLEGLADRQLTEECAGKLIKLMKYDDPYVRLSAAVAHCKLVEASRSRKSLPFTLSLSTEAEEVMIEITNQALKKLSEASDEVFRKRVCTSLHPLCKRPKLREKIMQEDVFEKLMACAANAHARDRTVRGASMQALSLLVTDWEAGSKLNSEASSKFLKIQKPLLRMLQMLNHTHNNQLTIVSILRIIRHLVQTSENGSPTPLLDKLCSSDNIKLDVVVSLIHKVLEANKRSHYVLSAAMDAILELLRHKTNDMGESVMKRNFDSMHVILLKRLPTDRRWAIHSVANILSNDKTSEAMIKCGLLFDLVKLLCCHNGYMAATEAIRSLLLGEIDKPGDIQQLCNGAQQRLEILCKCLISAGKNKSVRLQQLNGTFAELPVSSRQYDEMFISLWKKHPLHAVYFVHHLIDRKDSEKLAFLQGALDDSEAPKIVVRML